MTDFKKIAKNCICGMCTVVAVCVQVVTPSENHCEPVSICRAIVPEMPHGPEPKDTPPPATGKTIVTFASSTSALGADLASIGRTRKNDG
jgi:hypothetical protein